MSIVDETSAVGPTCPHCLMPAVGTGSFTMQGRAVYHSACYDAANNLRARIADLERQLAEAWEVKPLEWWEAELPSRGGGKYKADGYTIRRIEGLWLLDFAGDSRSDWRFTSLQGAKDHAQFLHTARILSALKGTP